MREWCADGVCGWSQLLLLLLHPFLAAHRARSSTTIAHHSSMATSSTASPVLDKQQIQKLFSEVSAPCMLAANLHRAVLSLIAASLATHLT
jgi:hypothetical protein